LPKDAIVWYFELTENKYIVDHHFNTNTINVGIDSYLDKNCTKSKDEYGN